MPETLVTLPAEILHTVGFVENDRPGVLTVNTALRGFEPRAVFRWQLSLLIEAQDLAEHRLPSATEQQVLRAFEAALRRRIAADGNALFAARLTHDGGHELIWRVHDVAVARAEIQALIDSRAHPREFSTRLDDDPQWERIAEYLAQVG